MRKKNKIVGVKLKLTRNQMIALQKIWDDLDNRADKGEPGMTFGHVRHDEKMLYITCFPHRPSRLLRGFYELLLEEYDILLTSLD